MKVTIKVEQEFDIKFLQVKAGVRYWEDSKVNGVDDEEGTLIPFRKRDLWTPKIEIETGKIIGWPQGTTAEVHYKVVDCCGWELQTEDGKGVLSVEDGYVPADTLCPKGGGYGDYIIMDIDGNGIIADWEFNSEDFINDDED